MNVEVEEYRFDRATSYCYHITLTEEINLYSLKPIPLDRLKKAYSGRYALEEQRRD